VIFFRGLNLNGSGKSTSKNSSKDQVRFARQDRKLEQQKTQLMDSFELSKRRQVEATGEGLKVGEKSVTAQKVAGEQVGYHFKNWVRDTQERYGATPISKPEQPPITPKQYIKLGKEGLQTTPEVVKMSTKLVQSQREWDKASKLEDKILKKMAQQGKVYEEKLFTPENGASGHLIHSVRFGNTVQQRYGENPFKNVADPRRGPITPDMPQPIGYSSSKGWKYAPKIETYLNNLNKPEDISWMSKVQGSISTPEQIRILEQPY
jgi:hypothetical protein